MRKCGIFTFFILESRFDHEGMLDVNEVILNFQMSLPLGKQSFNGAVIVREHGQSRPELS